MKTKRSEPDAEKTKKVTCQNGLCSNTNRVVKDNNPNTRVPVSESDDEESIAVEYYKNCNTCGVFFCDCCQGRSKYKVLEDCGSCGHLFCEKCRDDPNLCIK